MSTEHIDDVYAETAFRLGARGYVLKRKVETELTAAMRTVLAGDTYLFTVSSRIYSGSSTIRTEVDERF